MMLTFVRDAVGVSLSLCLLSGLFVTHAQAQACLNVFPAGVSPSVPQHTSQVLRILCSNGFATGYDAERHTPVWSSEVITREDVAQSLALNPGLYPDDRLAEEQRADHIDYAGTEYRAGALRPHADAASLAQQHATYVFSNTVPLWPALYYGIGEGVERTVRGIARQYGVVYSATGPLFTRPVSLETGPHHIPVPDYWWKAVWIPKMHAAGVYVCENRPHAPRCVQVTLEALRERLGIIVFPALAEVEQIQRFDLPDPEESPDEPEQQLYSLHHYQAPWSPVLRFARVAPARMAHHRYRK